MRSFFSILFALFWCISCSNQSVQNEPQKLSVQPFFKLALVKTVRLESTAEVMAPLDITSLQVHREHLYILDGFKLQQAFIYNTDGSLKRLVGKSGQGPGEYRLPGGFCRTRDRIHMVHHGKKYSIFDQDGKFLHQRSKIHPGTIGNKIYPGPNNTAFVTFYSRYTPGGTIYHVDQNGQLIRLFSPPDDEFVLFWDMVSPMGNLIVTEDHVAQVFVHKYEVLFFDFTGNLTRKVQLASNIYNPPDFEAAQQLPKQKEKLREFARAYTLVEGFFPLGSGYITVLSHTHLGDESQVIEYWDQDFEGQGRTVVPQTEKVVGTHMGEILFYNGDTSELIYRKPDQIETSEVPDGMRSQEKVFIASD